MISIENVDPAADLPDPDAEQIEVDYSLDYH
jgi:hypothetical protein